MESKEKIHRSLHQPDIDTLLIGCKDCGWSFLLHQRQYDSGTVPESAGLCVACSRASKQLYLESLGNAGLLALSAWTSRSTQGRMEGLTRASSDWWYDLRSGHQVLHVHEPHVLHGYWTARVGLVVSLENARTWATYEIRSMIRQRHGVGGDIRLCLFHICIVFGC